MLHLAKSIFATPPKKKVVRENENRPVEDFPKTARARITFNDHMLYYDENTQFTEEGKVFTDVDTKACRKQSKDFWDKVKANRLEPRATSPHLMGHSPFKDSHPMAVMQFQMTNAGLVTAHDNMEKNGESKWVLYDELGNPVPEEWEKLNATWSIMKRCGILGLEEYNKRVEKATGVVPDDNKQDYVVIDQDGSKILKKLDKSFLHVANYELLIRSAFVQFVAETGSKRPYAGNQSFEKFLKSKFHLQNARDLFDEKRTQLFPTGVECDRLVAEYKERSLRRELPESRSLNGAFAAVDMNRSPDRSTAAFTVTPQQQMQEDRLNIEREESNRRLKLEKEESDRRLKMQEEQSLELVSSVKKLVHAQETMADSANTMAKTASTNAGSIEELVKTNAFLAGQVATPTKAPGTPKKKAASKKKKPTTPKTSSKAPNGTRVRITCGEYQGQEGTDNGKGWIKLDHGGNVRKSADNHMLI